jgi:hypothetical protein
MREAPSSDCDYPEGEQDTSSSGLAIAFGVLFAIAVAVTALVALAFYKRYRTTTLEPLTIESIPEQSDYLVLVSVLLCYAQLLFFAP